MKKWRKNGEKIHNGHPKISGKKVAPNNKPFPFVFQVRIKTNTSAKEHPEHHAMNITLSQGDWSRDVTEFFGCAGCNRTLRDMPIYNCKCGALFCKDCLDYFEETPCSVCGSECVSTASRCKPMENLLQLLPKRYCRHAGCAKSSSSLEALQWHEDNTCTRRPVACRTCNQEVPMAALVDHVNQTHNTPVGIFGDKLLFAIAWEPGEMWHGYRKVTFSDGPGEGVAAFGLHVHFRGDRMVAWVSQDCPPLRVNEGKYAFSLAMTAVDGGSDVLAAASGPCTPNFINGEDYDGGDNAYPMLYANTYAMRSATNPLGYLELEITVVERAQ